MNWLANNWQGLLGAGGLIAGVASWIVHNVGHVAHKVVIDDIAGYLQNLNSHLQQQGSNPPPLPDSVRNPPT